MAFFLVLVNPFQKDGSKEKGGKGEREKEREKRKKRKRVKEETEVDRTRALGKILPLCCFCCLYLCRSLTRVLLNCFFGDHRQPISLVALVGSPDRRVCSLPRGDRQLRKSLVARLHPRCIAKTSSLRKNIMRTRVLVFRVNKLRQVGNLHRFPRVSVCVHPRKGGLCSVPELAEKMKEIVVC